MNDTQYLAEQPPYESAPQQTQLVPQEIPEIPKPVVLTIGDVSIHWLWFPLPQKKEENTWDWHSRQCVESVVLHGGAWCLDNFIRMLLEPSHARHVYTYGRFPLDRLRAADTRHILHVDKDCQYKAAAAFRESEGQGRITSEPYHQKIYRVHDDPRYYGPPSETNLAQPKLKGCSWTAGIHDKNKEAQKQLRTNPQAVNDTRWALEQVPHYYPNDVFPQIVVIHDQNNGFNRKRENWEEILPARNLSSRQTSRTDREKTIILTLNEVSNLKKDPPHRNELWNHLKDEGYLNQTVAILSATDLRRAGVQISRSISWERTAYDFVSELYLNGVLKELANASHLVVRFGLVGLIHYLKSEQRCFLYYDPEHIEGEYDDPKRDGVMWGYNSILASTIVASLFKQLHRIPQDFPQKGVIAPFPSHSDWERA